MRSFHPRHLLPLLVLTCILMRDEACATGTLVTEVTSSSALHSHSITSDNALGHIAAWPFFKPLRRPIYDSLPLQAMPHPAVARIIVPEKRATAYGSGTLVDVRDQYGLVVTNWHVVSDSQGVVEVIFPNGFRSHARPLKVDSDWDLAALVIWRPPIEPVTIATQPPRPGDLLTIHGYGQGQYRIATGRCTTYYAPHENYPQEMVELDVEARQGDSGGPIFNQRGELAGVLFGAGQGTTLGSFAPRVACFLATLAPDIGQANEQALVAVADRPAPRFQQTNDDLNRGFATYPSSPWSPANGPQNGDSAGHDGMVNSVTRQAASPHTPPALAAAFPTDSPLSWQDITANGWYDPAKSALAVVGLAAIVLRLVKVVR